jgi:hypothetical protein
LAQAAPATQGGERTESQSLSQFLPQATSQAQAPTGAVAQALHAKVDNVKWAQASGRQLIHVNQLHWDLDATLGQTRKLDMDEVQEKVDSLSENPPDTPVGVMLWLNEGV